MRYDVILFDADGTLFDYDAAEATALQSALARFGIPYTAATHEAYRRINSALWKRLEQGLVAKDALKLLRFSRLFEEVGAAADAAAFSDAYLSALAEAAALIDGAEELIAALHRRGRDIHIITNGIGPVQRGRLNRSPLVPWIGGLFISEEIGAAKPHPDFFHHVMAAIGNPDPRRVLVVGDALSADIAGGSMAGLDTCWVNLNGAPQPEAPVPTYTITKLPELLTLPGVQ